MYSYKIEKKILYFFFAFLILLQIYFLLFNEKTTGGADNVTHFQIARYAFKYPQLFLDLWGKPVYTTLLAPFTLLGFKFSQVLNLLIAVITLLFVFKLSRVLYPSGATFIVVLTTFAPVYFLLMLSCLTETLFSLVLILAVYFFVKNRFILSAIILSFIPFVRSEGYILFPIFALAYLFKRSWFSVLFLATGTIFYSVIGYFAFDDFLWIVNRFPYQIKENVYGSGELFHFVKNSNFIFGVPLMVLIVIGFGFWSWQVIRKFRLKDENLWLFVIIAGSWLAYFAAHSYVWWQGKSSLGLIRVIAGVIPLAGLTATKGVQFFFETFKKKWLVYSLLVAATILQTHLFFVRNHLPYKADPVDKLIDNASEFVKKEFPDSKIYYFNPEFIFHLGLDPYDHSKSVWGIGDNLKPSNTMDFGDILIWDAHFGPNEGRIKYESLQNDNNLLKIRSFIPQHRITVLGGYDYSIHIYKKVRNKARLTDGNVLKSNMEFTKGVSEQVVELNGETVFELKNSNTYSPTIVIHLEDLPKKDFYEIELQTQFKSNEEIPDKEVLLVISVEDNKNTIRYDVKPLIYNIQDTCWKTVTLTSVVPSDVPETTVVKMYLWNRGNKQLYIKQLNSETISY